MSQFVGSPNYTAGRGGNNVSGIVIHWMVGTLASTDSVFQNRSRNTSAHYGIEDDNVHQYVDEANTAYHAGNWDVNQKTIGIEHSAAPGRAPSDKTYAQSAQLIAALSRRYNFPINRTTIRKHSEIVATQCSGDVNSGGVDIDRLIKRALEIGNGSTPAPTPVQPPTPINVKGRATVTIDSLNVRTAPRLNAPLGGSQRLTKGQTFDYTEAVQGDSVNGVSTWLKSTKGNFVWSGGTDYPTTPAVTQGGMARAVRPANVRSAPNTNAPLAGSKTLPVGATFEYSAIVRGQYVAQNGIGSDRWYHSRVGNYTWSGNIQAI